jgi:hypothetical protein
MRIMRADMCAYTYIKFFRLLVIVITLARNSEKSRPSKQFLFENIAPRVAGQRDLAGMNNDTRLSNNQYDV